MKENMRFRLVLNIIGTCVFFFVALRNTEVKEFYAALALAGFMGFILSCIDYAKEKK